MDVSKREKTAISGNHEVAKHGEAHAESSHGALNGSHNRQRQVGQLVNHWMEQPDKLLKCFLPLLRGLSDLLVKHLDVATSHEAGAGAFKQHTADGRIVIELQKHFREIGHHLIIQRVQALWTVKHDLEDRALLLGKNRIHGLAGSIPKEAVSTQQSAVSP